jgi:hypothetical protein
MAAACTLYDTCLVLGKRKMNPGANSFPAVCCGSAGDPFIKDLTLLKTAGNVYREDAKDGNVFWA